MELYADYEPERLMSFLVSSQAYGLEAAAELCEHRGLVREQVFVLGRMGNARQALELIISKLADIPQVLHWCMKAAAMPQHGLSTSVGGSKAGSCSPCNAPVWAVRELQVSMAAEAVSARSLSGLERDNAACPADLCECGAGHRVCADAAGR